MGEEKKDAGGLESLQARLEKAVTSVKATSTAVRDKSKFKILDDLREMAAANYRDLMSQGLGLSLWVTMVRRPTEKQLWINGRVSEDREGRMEEVRAHVSC